MSTGDNKSTRARTLFWISIALLAMMAGLLLAKYLAPSPKPLPILSEGTFLPNARNLSPFQLVDYDGNPFGPAQLQDKWSFVFFGYTNCPDVCPATMYQFQQIAKGLQQDARLDASTRFVFISVDPDRDTPQFLKKYVQYYNPAFLGVTGADSELLSLSREMGVIYLRMPNDDNAEDYLIDHSAAILLTNPAGQLAAFFSAPHHASAIISDYKAIRNYDEESK